MMYTISVEIYSENATSGIFNKSGLTQPWNIVHQSKTLHVTTTRILPQRLP